MKSILILSTQEHLRLGYSALLSVKGFEVHTVPALIEKAFAAVVDTGDDLDKHTSQLLCLKLDKVVYIVSENWAGMTPSVGAYQYILRKPTTGGAILKCLQ